jgi:hypothetical protein
VRPHSLAISRQPNGSGNHFRAITKHINAAGPLVKIEAVTDWGAPVHVELSHECFSALQLAKDETVFVIPRDVAVFQAKDRDHI